MKAVPIVHCSLVSLVLFTGSAEAQGRAAPACDASAAAVQRDHASLRDTIRESLTFLFPGSSRARLDTLAATVETEYVGAGHLVPTPTDALVRPPRETTPAAAPARITAWTGVNPATCNQFRIRVTEDTKRLIAASARDKGLGKAAPGSGMAVTKWPFPPLEEQLVPPQSGPYFSGCQDTRARTDTTGYPFRTIANLSQDGQSSFCTGTLVGPRHILTAAHCLYQGNNNWYDFTVIPGRDTAYWPFGSTEMSDTDGLNQGFRWYWIPGALAEAQYPDFYSGLDIGIIVLPQRLGDTAGWMGVVAQPDAVLSAATNRNYGYPAGGGGPIGIHPVQFEGAMYGDVNECALGNFSHHDAQGWARVAGHSCDSSSGHSGGPIYNWVWEGAIQAFVPAVSLIISHHPAFVNDFDCANNPVPYSGTRITPEYIEAFLFFRSWKP